MNEAFYSTTSTPHGPFTVICDPDGAVVASDWARETSELVTLIHSELQPAQLIHDDQQCVDAITATLAFYDGYFSYVEKLKTRQQSGPFRMQAWAALRKIQPGQTITYAELAERSGNSAAVRATAGACAANAVALFVPCHRVIAAHGRLGGFRYGTELKQKILDLETQSMGGIQASAS
ncbi:MAG: methylated-DNA--[protein]-cysteine S-methyltransferase [Corynebacterium sp.]|nr:methylated-DNA--[protein]-cysteine S-methyltransferase [Corynebacterium sp.]